MKLQPTIRRDSLFPGVAVIPLRNRFGIFSGTLRQLVSPTWSSLRGALYYEWDLRAEGNGPVVTYTLPIDRATAARLLVADTKSS